MKIDEYRNCVEEGRANCPYVGKNKYGVWCCPIDKIVQVEFYGCTPSEVIEKIDSSESNFK